jgi:hypothetical protein
MTVAAPPRPPQFREAAEHDPGEALIKEAQQRARRRRWFYGGAAAAMVVIAAVAGFSALSGDSSPPPGAARNIPTPPTPIDPGLPGPEQASTLLTSWTGPNTYGFVYADGRVIWQDTRLANYVNPFVGSWDSVDWLDYVAPPRERRLSPRGLELVRAGKITAQDLKGHWPQPCPGGTCPFDYWGPNLPKNAWAEPTWRTYKPFQYAVWFPSLPMDDADQVLAQLPAPVQALLRDKQRTYAMDETQGMPPFESFEITPAEAAILDDLTDDEFVRFLPVYPHGEPRTRGD